MNLRWKEHSLLYVTCSQQMMNHFQESAPLNKHYKSFVVSVSLGDFAGLAAVRRHPQQTENIQLLQPQL